MSDPQPEAGSQSSDNSASRSNQELSSSGDPIPAPVAPEQRPPEEAEDRLSLARALTLLGSADLDDPLDPLLQLVGEGIGVSRAYVFQFRDEGRFMDNTHEWCAPGVTPQKDRLQGLPAEAFPWWVEQLKAGEGVVAGSLDELPREAARERELLEEQEIEALLVFPLGASDGELVGFIGFDDVKGPRQWSRRETESLELICQMSARELELRRASLALLRLQERISRTERIARVGGWEFHPASGYTWWSDQAFEILGVPRSWRPTSLFDFFQRVHPEDRDRARRVSLAAMDDGRPFRYECRLIPEGGEVRHVEVHGDVVGPEGGQQRIAGTLQDITERRRLETELGHAQRMEAVGKLAGGVAHDFNNLLLVILGTAELLLERERGSQGEELREDLLQILEAAERGAALTRKLLAFSRRRGLEPRRTDLNAVVAGMEGMLQGLLTEERNLRIELGDEVDFVRVDRSQLEQIVMNLAMNAREAMKPGGTLRLATVRLDLDQVREVGPAQTLDAGCYAVVSVADDGAGMPPDVRARAFEPFFTTRTEAQGAGLGLASVYGIARQAGGAVAVESEPGVGSLFQVFLPMDATGRADDGMNTRGDHIARTQAANGQSTSGSATILLVEDDVAVARMARRVLERAGYRVLVAHLPDDALRLIGGGDEDPGLVVTDAIMPEMRGVDLVREIRKTRPDVRALYMSGYPLASAEAHDMVEAGAPFLPKPFSTVRLLAAVRESLQNTPPARG